jgi:uncharacterized protein YegJ (DUF2314 family)
MSKAVNEIRNRVSKLRSLTGYEFCSLVDALDDEATEEEWINAWNIDQGIIMGMINDMELLCGDIDTEYFD